MDKNQHALDSLVRSAISIYDKDDIEFGLLKINALRMQELVNRAKPMKPVLDDGGFDVCPQCKGFGSTIQDHDAGEKFKHCKDCGQAIEWGDGDAKL